jgi:hypothetical protein
MTKNELRAAKRAIGCTTAQLAERLDMSRWHLKKMLAKKDRQQVSAPVAEKVRELITGVSSLPIWQQCPFCGGDLLRQSKQPGGGVVVLHRCPAEAGVTIRIASEQLGLTLTQAEAALGRRPGGNRGGC